jgi:quinoprotein glucose dehydrogenase
MRTFKRLAIVALVIVAGLYGAWKWHTTPRMRPYSSATALERPADSTWPQYGNDPGGTRYSPLDQVNRSNVNRLELAWTYQTGELADVRSGKDPFNPWEATPILVEDTLIGCSPAGRLFALDPATGHRKWTFDPGVKLSEIGHAFVKCRGVSSFEDPVADPGAVCKTRIVYGTGDLRVIALDARSGERCPGFGTNGEVQLDAGGPLAFPNEVQIHSPPAIVGDVAVFGSTMADMVRADAPSGMIRALDVRTGALRWTFDPVPRDDADPAAATWGNGSSKSWGAGNAWSTLSADPVNDLVFIPTTSPSADTYGGGRPGANRYTDSLVAIRASTGEVAWHFQFVHHDVWDYDLPSQPILVDLRRGETSVPAVVQLTKQGMVFVFNRLTGEPLFPIEERPVPQAGAAPGEVLSPTQPFSTLPPLVQQGMTADDAWGFTPWDRSACRRKIKGLVSEGIYTPPTLQGTLHMPASAGGANWGSGAIVPSSGILFVPTLHMPAVLRLIPREKWDGKPGSVMTGINFPQNGTPYVFNLSFLVSPLGAPCSAPPWGRLTAIDLVTGTIKWQVALGSIERLVPKIPLPLELGTPQAGGPVATRGGLVFIAASADDKFRAFDLETGAKLWEVKLPAGGQATPMTYAVDGRQYIVLVAGGHPYYNTGQGDYVLAYALARD